MPSYSFSSPPFSFMDVQNLSDQTCGQNEFPCLPVMFLDEMAFQVICETDDESFDDLTIIASVDDECGASGINKPINFESTWMQISSSKWVGNFFFNSSSVFEDYEPGKCFAISIYIQEGDNYTFQYCFTQCFAKIEGGGENNECYTTVYSYRDTENSFGFDYSDPEYLNIVRLPTYLHSPINVEEEKSYAKSDGSTKKLMHRIWKDYQVKTDYFPAGWLEKFAIMTAHSSLFVVDYYGGVNDYMVRMEKVDVAWGEADTPGFKLAQAKTVLRLATARQTLNSNCV